MLAIGISPGLSKPELARQAQRSSGLTLTEHPFFGTNPHKVLPEMETLAALMPLNTLTVSLSGLSTISKTFVKHYLQRKKVTEKTCAPSRSTNSRASGFRSTDASSLRSQ